MQPAEFKNLMDGKPAKWAEMTDDMFTNLAQSGRIEARKLIQENEHPISEDVNDRIQKFIAWHRRIGTKESKIRAKVKMEFGITVI